MSPTDASSNGAYFCIENKKECYTLFGIVILVVIAAIIATLTILLPRESDGKMQSNGQNSSSTVVALLGSYELLETVPHDPGAFTQGLELNPLNPLEYFESTGLYGQSSIRRVDLQTGQVLQRRDLSSRYFGEGLTYFDGKLVQITWKENTAFVYNSTNLSLSDEFVFETSNGEGWGICYVKESHKFLVTDGSNFLHAWDASSYELIEKIPVVIRRAGSRSSSLEEVYELNELEWDVHSDTVLSNVWYEDYIIRIDPVTGAVLAQYDLSALSRPPEADVLNGIAVTDVPNEIWVTGKLWSSMYLIRLVDA